MFAAALGRSLPVLMKVTCSLPREPAAGLGRNKGGEEQNVSVWDSRH